jgi:glycosyltransferase involved in cell wall biosynthesis
MDKLKICVYAIALNEAKHVERFYASCEGADQVLIADTGSTDNTRQLATYLGCDVHQISIKPWRFDTARNAALALIPEDYDVCISLDMDEVLTPGWRKIVEDAWRPGTTRLQYRFNNGAGNIFNATKIHIRHGYNWRYLCHEMIECDPRIKEQWSVIEDILIEHHPDNSKSRGQYLLQLEAAVKEDPYSHRYSWYLAREYWYYKQYEDSIKEFDRYLAMPSSVWHHERSFALRCQGKSLLKLGLNDQALAKLRLAVDTSRYIRDTWLDLAQACYELKQWQECFYASIQGLTITNREYVFTSTPDAWGYRLYDLAALSAHNLKMDDTAVKYGLLAIEQSPTDQRLIKNLGYYQQQRANASL